MLEIMLGKAIVIKKTFGAAPFIGYEVGVVCVCPILQVFIIDRSRRTGIECPKTTLAQNRARIRRGV